MLLEPFYTRSLRTTINLSSTVFRLASQNCWSTQRPCRYHYERLPWRATRVHELFR